MIATDKSYISDRTGSTGNSSKRIPEIKEQIDGVKRAAKGRQAQAGPSSGKGKKKSGSGKLPEAITSDTRDRVAIYTNMSGRTWGRRIVP